MSPEDADELIQALMLEKETNTRLFLAVPHERLVEKMCALWALSCAMVMATDDPIAKHGGGEILNEVNLLVKAYNNDAQLVVTAFEED